MSFYLSCATDLESGDTTDINTETLIVVDAKKGKIYYPKWIENSTDCPDIRTDKRYKVGHHGSTDAGFDFSYFGPIEELIIIGEKVIAAIHNNGTPPDFTLCQQSRKRILNQCEDLKLNSDQRKNVEVAYKRVFRTPIALTKEPAATCAPEKKVLSQEDQYAKYIAERKERGDLHGLPYTRLGTTIVDYYGFPLPNIQR